MNQVFSFNRFGMLFKKHTVEHFKSYLMSLAVMVGILVMVILVILLQGKYLREGPQAGMFVAFMFFAGTIFTSNVFADLGEKRKTIATLTLPSSSFEKFFIGWLYSYIIFQVLFIVVFYTIMFIVLHAKHRFGEPPVTFYNAFDNSANDASITFIAFAFLQSVTLFGAVFFKKMHFIKTAFVLFITVAVIWLLNIQVLQAMIHHQIAGNPPFMGANFHDGDNYSSVDLASENWVLALFAGLTLIMWAAAYFRLKEKQV